MELKLKADASKFRKQFGFGSSEPIDFKNLFFRLDILAAIFPLSDDFSGMCIKSEENRFILINSNHSIGRQNFTICHELYHLYFDPDFEPHKCQTGLFPKKGGSELLADQFASFLILPEDGILSMIPESELNPDGIKLLTLLKIEQTFQCSRTALLIRLLKMKQITQSYLETYSLNVKQGAIQYGFECELYTPNTGKKILGPYGGLANQLLENEKISQGHYRELMAAIGISIDELTKDENSQC
jgi:Zn-dependent peptidase ImmA (M78 family)